MEKNISPKNKKEILEICQNNFFNYSTLTQTLIIISVVLSATTLALYLTEYIIPTTQDIIYDMDWEDHCRYNGATGVGDELLPPDLTPQEAAVMALFNTEAKLDMQQLLNATE